MKRSKESEQNKDKKSALDKVVDQISEKSEAPLIERIGFMLPVLLIGFICMVGWKLLGGSLG